MFDINNPNHRVNCVKLCLNGHKGSEITNLNFSEDTLLSASQNGLIVLWNLSDNSIIRIPHYIQSPISHTVMFGDKGFLVLNNSFELFLFSKEVKHFTSSRMSTMQLTKTEYHCKYVIDIGVEIGSDILTSVERFNKSIWFGTEKGQLLKMDLKKMFEETEIDQNEFFKDNGFPKKEQIARNALNAICRI